MFWESRGFWYSLFLFLHGGSHERQQGAEQHCAAEEIPEVRLSDQVTDGKYSRSKTDHDIAWIKPFLKLVRWVTRKNISPMTSGTIHR